MLTCGKGKFINSRLSAAILAAEVGDLHPVLAAGRSENAVAGGAVLPEVGRVARGRTQGDRVAEANGRIVPKVDRRGGLDAQAEAIGGGLAAEVREEDVVNASGSCSEARIGRIVLPQVGRAAVAGDEWKRVSRANEGVRAEVDSGEWLKADGNGIGGALAAGIGGGDVEEAACCCGKGRIGAIVLPKVSELTAARDEQKRRARTDQRVIAQVHDRRRVIEQVHHHRVTRPAIGAVLHFHPNQRGRIRHEIWSRRAILPTDHRKTDTRHENDAVTRTQRGITPQRKGRRRADFDQQGIHHVRPAPVPAPNDQCVRSSRPKVDAEKGMGGGINGAAPGIGPNRAVRTTEVIGDGRAVCAYFVRAMQRQFLPHSEGRDKVGEIMPAPGRTGKRKIELDEVAGCAFLIGKIDVTHQAGVFGGDVDPAIRPVLERSKAGGPGTEDDERILHIRRCTGIQVILDDSVGSGCIVVNAGIEHVSTGRNGHSATKWNGMCEVVMVGELACCVVKIRHDKLIGASHGEF